MSYELKKLMKGVACSEVDQICRPLFEASQINLFIHSRIYSNGKYWTLSNRGDWVAYFYEAKYLNPGILSKPVKAGRYLLLKELDIPELQIRTARESFNADHWFNIIQTHKNYYDVFAFATHRNNDSIINTYLNNFDVLDHFILYFKDKAQHLIESAESQKILQSSLLEKNDFAGLEKQSSEEIDISRRQFYSQTVIERYYFDFNQVQTYVTKREHDCIMLLAQGKTYKEVAANLNITSRTVGYYISNVKDRIGCYNRSQIINLFAKQ